MDLETFDKIGDPMQDHHLQCFASLCESIPNDESGYKLKSAILNKGNTQSRDVVTRKGITRALVAYMKSLHSGDVASIDIHSER